MLHDDPLTVRQLLRRFTGKVMVTWLLVLLENVLIALIPLSIGFAIDGLLAGETGAVWVTGGALAGVTVLGVLRRAYDTRAYGTMRVLLGEEVARRQRDLPVTRVSARVDMSRELVDFLEGHVPLFATAAVQLIVSAVILFTFQLWLGLAAVGMLALTLVVYACFDRSFFLGNQQINEQVEKQIVVLESREPKSIRDHLRALRRAEVRLSDTEAWLYGLLFLIASAFVLGNLGIAASFVAVTVGTMFAIVSYSWEFVESSLQLPVTLQQWSRLTEVTGRLNVDPDSDGDDPETDLAS